MRHQSKDWCENEATDPLGGWRSSLFQRRWLMLLAYDEDRYERVFVAKVLNQGDVAKMLNELQAEVSEGEPIMIEIWKISSEETRRERIAKRRLDFFNS